MATRSILSAFSVVLLGASCSVPAVRPWGRVGYLHLDGDIAASAGPASASVSADSLGLDNYEAIPNIGADFDWDPIHLAVEGLVAKYQGSGFATTELSIDNDGSPIVIPLGTQVESEIDVGLYLARATWDILPSAPVDLGIGVGGGLIDYGVSFDATILTQPRSVGIDDELPFGFLTARVGRQLGDFELLGHISGLGFEFGNEEINFIDIEGSLIWTFWYMKTGAAALEVGYRYIELDYEFDPSRGNFSVDAALRGPFVGLSVRL